MTIFWILLAFTFFLYPICRVVRNRIYKVPDLSPVQNKDIKLYFILVSLAMILIIGLRGLLVGVDTLNYYFSYAQVQNVSVRAVLLADIAEKGYILFEILGHRLHLGFAGYNLLYATVNISIISYIIYKKSTMPWLSYFLYICFEFFILELSMMRQTLAMSVVALAIVTDKNETAWDFLKYALLIYIAQTFHTSAIIMLPFWFVKKIPMNNLTMIITVLVIGLAYLMREEIAHILYSNAVRMSDKYANYGEIGTGNAGFRLYLMVAVTLALGVILQRYRRVENSNWPFFGLCLMLILFPAVQSGGVFMRIYFYYYLFIILYVPNLVTALDPKKDMYIKLLIVVLYLIVGVYFLHGSLGPKSIAGETYKFFWQPLYD